VEASFDSMMADAQLTLSQEIRRTNEEYTAETKDYRDQSSRRRRIRRSDYNQDSKENYNSSSNRQRPKRSRSRSRTRDKFNYMATIDLKYPPIISTGRLQVSVRSLVSGLYVITT